MTLHMFRAFVITDGMSQSELQQAVDDWTEEHQKWEDESTEPTVRVIPDDIDLSIRYYQVDIRFERTDTKDNILQKLEDKIVNKVAWYRIGYHSCDHDEQGERECPWSEWETSEWTDKDIVIPEYIPSFSDDT